MVNILSVVPLPTIVLAVSSTVEEIAPENSPIKLTNQTNTTET